jgi:hypothetical protein
MSEILKVFTRYATVYNCQLHGNNGPTTGTNWKHNCWLTQITLQSKDVKNTHTGIYIPL